MSCSCNHKDVDNDAWIEETLIKFIKCLCSCGPTEAETLTLESCAILEVLADPLPQPR